MSACRKAERRTRGIPFSCALPAGHAGDCRAVVLYSIPRFVCKRCGAESPAGIGYAAHNDGPLPAPAADCPEFHYGEEVTL